MAAFITLDARLKTFQTWPRGLSQKPRDLAEAGLYYTGVSDELKCFHCDGGLKGWEPNDNPWIEHAKWFPHCRHILLLKGRDFIEEAKKEHLKNHGPRASRRAEELMHMEPAISALNMGLDHEDVKKAIFNQLELCGRMFKDFNALVDAASALALTRQAQQDNQERVNNVIPDISEAPANSGIGFVPLRAPATSSQEVEEEAARPNSVEASSLASSGPDILIGHSLPVDEGERTKDDRMDLVCKICMEKQVAVVILPCGHLCSCTDCASSLTCSCPICRKRFKGYARVYLV